jgi:hypothetical protein
MHPTTTTVNVARSLTVELDSFLCLHSCFYPQRIQRATTTTRAKYRRLMRGRGSARARCSVVGALADPVVEMVPAVSDIAGTQEKDSRRALFDIAVQASVALGEAVRRSFGPNGIDVLLESSEGHVTCSNCGRQILSSLSLSHPVGSIISKSVTNYHDNTGDGSKKMLLVLSGTMKELRSPVHSFSKIEVSNALLWLNQAVIPELTARLRKNNKLICQTARDSEDLRRMLLKIATSCEYY